VACSKLNFTFYTTLLISGLYHCSVIRNVSLYDTVIEFYGLYVRQTCCEIFTWLAVHRQLVLETIFDVAEL
jgi:hypothetical protein